MIKVLIPVADGFEELTAYFKDTIDDNALKVEASHLKTAEMPAVIMGSEESKRIE
mgnify:CR=1 FL=1